jgi:hypothetical protein
MKKIGVYLEKGRRRVFAGAIDWPGWCRSARDEDDALRALLRYAPRYAATLGPGLGFTPPAELSALEVIERLDGNSGTDFGAPMVPPTSDGRKVDRKALTRLVALLEASWAAFDAAVHDASGAVLAKGPRGGGRDLDAIVDHVAGADKAYLSRLGGTSPKARGTEHSARLGDVRTSILGVISARSRGDPLPDAQRKRSLWSPRYGVRRSAWHALDHAWEIEDRAGTPS